MHQDHPACKEFLKEMDFNANRRWGDNTFEASIEDSRSWCNQLEEYKDEEGVTEVEPLLMLSPLALQSKWVVKKVKEVKRQLGYAFAGREDHVEDFSGR